MRRTISLSLALALLVACKGADGPTAASVCSKIVEAGLGANCHEDKPGGLYSGAVEKFVFDLPSVPGKTAQVLRFEKLDMYNACVEANEKAVMLVGPHRYGSASKLIFVQANSGMSLEDGKKLKALVEGL